MVVLVAVVILEVEQRAIVVGPLILVDPALLVGGDDPGVLLADGLDPHLEDIVFVRREPRQAGAVRREAGARALGITKEKLAWDEWRKPGG